MTASKLCEILTVFLYYTGSAYISYFYKLFNILSLLNFGSMDCIIHLYVYIHAFMLDGALNGIVLSSRPVIYGSHF